MCDYKLLFNSPYLNISLYHFVHYFRIILLYNAFLFWEKNVCVCVCVCVCFENRTNYFFFSYFRKYSSHVPHCLREWRSCAENAPSVSLLSSYEWNIRRIIANIFPPERRAPCLRLKLRATITHFLENS